MEVPLPCRCWCTKALCSSKFFLMLGAWLGFSGSLGTALRTDVCWLAGLRRVGSSEVLLNPETVLSIY